MLMLPGQSAEDVGHKLRSRFFEAQLWADGVTRPPEYSYPGPDTGVVPDSSSTDERWLEDARRQVAAQLADPVGSRPMVVEVGVNVGNLIDDEAAKASIGSAADALHTQAHGE